MDGQNHHPRDRASKPPQVIGRIGPMGLSGCSGAHHRASLDAAWSIPQDAPPGILIVSGRSAWARRLQEALAALGAAVAIRTSQQDARAALAAPSPEQGDLEQTLASEIAGESRVRIDNVLIDAAIADCALPDGDALPLAVIANRREIPVILAAKHASIDLAACAIEHGMADLVEVSGPFGGVNSDLTDRILALAARSRNHRSRRPICTRRLFRLHHGDAPANLLDARQSRPATSDLTASPFPEQAVKNVSTVSEFKGLIRGELDIEALLRTTLEFVLARSGPTNAAVFLPTTSGDYSLGAYVNYDCPKDTCDVLLDHLANAVAPRFEGVKGMAHLTTEAQLGEYLDHDADWLQGSHVVGFPCTHDGECLAIFMLFRDQRSPFAGPLLEQIKTVGELFAAQLARVIHIHHRHLPKNKWGMIGDPPAETDDYGDLAA
jgi:CheY-like chemotaxis protein